MNTLLGDIGNTDTKLCILNNNYKILKKIQFETIKIKNINYIKKKISFLINKSTMKKISLFSSVVPSAFKVIKKNLKNNFKIYLKELKETNFNKVIKRI